jgi:hypothetical protein
MNQKHAGISSMNGNTLWHTNSEGLYWCGHWYERTPLQLLNECETTILDLLKDYPELRQIKEEQNNV